MHKSSQSTQSTFDKSNTHVDINNLPMWHLFGQNTKHRTNQIILAKTHMSPNKCLSPPKNDNSPCIVDLPLFDKKDPKKIDKLTQT